MHLIFVHAHVCVGIQMYGGQREISLKCCSSGAIHCILRQNIPLAWNLPSRPGHLASKPGNLPLSTPPQHRNYTHTHACTFSFLKSKCWVRNSGLCSCLTSTLEIELSPQPLLYGTLKSKSQTHWTDLPNGCNKLVIKQLCLRDHECSVS